MNLKLHKPAQLISCEIKLLGSKSISNRILIIKALSGLSFSIKNLSDSDDTQHLKEALDNYSNISLIDVGHAGTDMRFLTAFLSLQTGSYELTGSERLQQRPVKDLVDVLKILGADITYINKEGYPPLLIKGKQLTGGKAEISGKVSSQFVTALLLVAPYFTNGLVLEIKDELVSKPYVNMTIEIMKEFGADVIWSGNKIIVQPIPYNYNKSSYAVESDWSAASYYYSIVALSPINTQLTINGLFSKSLQADAACADIYRSFGVKTEFGQGKIIISKIDTAIELNTFDYDFIECPDIAQTVACTCAGLNKSFSFTGVQTLKIKETDRIIALKNELEKLGAIVNVTDHSISYNTHEKLNMLSDIKIATYNDHRMAMSFAPLSVLHEDIIIENAEVVSKSYPEFWNDIKKTGIIQTQIS